MYNYLIAEMDVCVSWENNINKNKNCHYHDCIVLPRSLSAFTHETIPDVPDMKVWVRNICECSGTDYHKRVQNQAFYESENNIIMTIFDPYHPEKPGYSIEMSKDYSQVVYIPHIKEYDHYDLQWMMYPFEGRILCTGGLVLHGAAVEYNGIGFIFTGVSGAGKTTQAHLWQKYRNALITNGDCPAIRIQEDTAWMYGTPWCGTSGESINRRTHLNAVIIVKKGDTNSIHELKGNSAFLALLANVLHSSFDVRTLDLAIQNLMAIINYIQVFELTCTIREESVEILEKELLWTKQHQIM